MIVDLTLRCPTCGKRADMCFDHGEDWKMRNPSRAAEKLGSGSAARSGSAPLARSNDPWEERVAASAPPPLPDPNQGDDLAYVDYWDNRL